jgi:protein arginine N-methyltransferase 2
MRRAVSAENKRYVRQKLTYLEDRLVDEDGNSVMMSWEHPIMKATARLICPGGGDVLNIGFGMGLIDTEIQRLKPRSHTIIEPHPDVQAKMIDDGWGAKKNVTLHSDFWQNVVADLPAFDGIYFDTWDDTVEQFEYLASCLHWLLKSGGVFSWFNHPENPDLFQMVEKYGFSVERHRIRVRADGKKQQGKLHYYDARSPYYYLTEARWA